MSAEIAQVTDLDFDQIKNNLKEYFQRPDSPFKDWDFEGSGLNYLLDILAYNTHYNAINAHLAMNESFLDSAQVRSNVVSRAKLIGYTPRSRRGSIASLRIALQRSTVSDLTTLTLPRGATFSSSFGSDTFTFTTLNDTQGLYDPSIDAFVFNDVQISQGELKRLKFLVDGNRTNPRFLIDDETIDTSTLSVRVVDHRDTTNAVTYLPRESFVTIDGNSRVYFLSENFEGKYQVEFGDDTIGKKLDNQNIVELEFLSTRGREANGASRFSITSYNSIDVSNAVSGVVSITTQNPSRGGDERETTESIRRTAPYAYIAQNRGVTTNDYEALIRENIPDIEALSIWGGQYNDPPIYGKVFISAKPKDNLFLSSLQTQEILDYLSNLNVLTVKPEIVDPNYIFLAFDVFFKYNKNATTLSKTQLESRVRSAISEFNRNFLEDFDKVFRYSNFLGIIDGSNEAILNSFARIFVYKQVELIAANRTPFEVNFQMKLLGDIDSTDPFIESTGWKFNEQTYYLGDRTIEGSTTERRLFVYRLSDDLRTQITVIPDVGVLVPETGKLSIAALPTSFDTFIDITARPDSYDVPTVRNQLLSIDQGRTSVTGESDTTTGSGSSGGIEYDPVSRFRR